MLQATLTVNEAALYLKKCPRTIREWIARGRLAARKVGKSYVITEDAIREAIMPRVRPAGGVKEYDPERTGRIAELKRVLQGGRLNWEAYEESVTKEREAEKRTLKDMGLM